MPDEACAATPEPRQEGQSPLPVGLVLIYNTGENHWDRLANWPIACDEGCSAPMKPLYLQAGFTPMEAIQAATIIPARVMGMEKQSGTVEKGKRADLILVNGNPLEDIHNTRNVELVITNGRMYRTADLWQSVGFKP